MGSKHTPARWWNLGGVEEVFYERQRQQEERYRAEHAARTEVMLGSSYDPDGQSYVLEDSKRYIAPGETMEAIGWTTQQYMGAELLDVETREPIPASRDLSVGTEVFVPSLFGYYKATITGPRLAETESSLFYLDWNIDDRHAWTSGSQVNKAALKKMVINMKLKLEI